MARVEDRGGEDRAQGPSSSPGGDREGTDPLHLLLMKIVVQLTRNRTVYVQEMDVPLPNRTQILAVFGILGKVVLSKGIFVDLNPTLL